MPFTRERSKDRSLQRLSWLSIAPLSSGEGAHAVTLPCHLDRHCRRDRLDGFAQAQADNERQIMLFGGSPRAKNYNFFGFGGSDATRSR